MPVRRFLAAAAIALVWFSTGCGLVESSRRTMSRIAAVGTDDALDWTDEEAESWIEDAGREARGNQRREKDPDGALTRVLTSEKFRSIERNVGIDHD